MTSAHGDLTPILTVSTEISLPKTESVGLIFQYATIQFRLMAHPAALLCNSYYHHMFTEVQGKIFGTNSSNISVISFNFVADQCSSQVYNHLSYISPSTSYPGEGQCPCKGLYVTQSELSPQREMNAAPQMHFLA